jgi:hypothetical protein
MKAKWTVVPALALLVLACGAGFLCRRGAGASAAGRPVRVYAVGKVVAEFPDATDLSSPEAAYAAFMRALATGDPVRWGTLSVRQIREKTLVASPPPESVSPDEAEAWVAERIVEVHVEEGHCAQVISEMPKAVGGMKFRKRIFMLEDGRWMSEGESVYRTLEDARRSCPKVFEYFRNGRWWRRKGSLAMGGARGNAARRLCRPHAAPAARRLCRTHPASGT